MRYVAQPSNGGILTDLSCADGQARRLKVTLVKRPPFQPSKPGLNPQGLVTIHNILWKESTWCSMVTLDPRTLSGDHRGMRWTVDAPNSLPGPVGRANRGNVNRWR